MRKFHVRMAKTKLEMKVAKEKKWCIHMMNLVRGVLQEPQYPTLQRNDSYLIRKAPERC